MQTIFTTRGRRALTITTIALAGMAVLSFAIGGRDGGEAVGDEPVAEAGRVDRAAHISRYAPASAPGNAETDMVQVRQIDDMLAAAIAATQQYREVDRALADGYQPVTGVLTGSAMHFVSQRALEDAGFDVTRPEVLLYDDTSGGSLDLVGVAYLLPQHSASATPPGHFGPLAHWHAHR